MLRSIFKKIRINEKYPKRYAIKLILISNICTISMFICVKGGSSFLKKQCSLYNFNPDVLVLKQAYEGEAVNVCCFNEQIYNSICEYGYCNINYLQNKIESLGCFKTVEVSKLMFKNALSIVYESRNPAFYLGNISNILIDKDGCCFPCVPFFSPKKLPILFIPEEEAASDIRAINNVYIKIALTIILLMQNDKIEYIDLTRINGPVQEIYIGLCSGCILRMSKQKYNCEIKSYYLLKSYFLEGQSSQSYIIDLRIPFSACIKHK